MPSSFCEYANAEYDYEWDEYLDYVGLSNSSVSPESLADWLAGKTDEEVPERARELMRAFVGNHADDAS